MTYKAILAVVVDELKDIPYAQTPITENSVLGDWFRQVQRQDEDQGWPFSRCLVFLRDVEKRTYPFDIYLEDLLAARFDTVGALARAIKDRPL